MLSRLPAFDTALRTLPSAFDWIVDFDDLFPFAMVRLPDAVVHNCR
jgi:hypothetical protein